MNAKFNAENIVVVSRGKTIRNSYYGIGKKIRQVALRKDSDGIWKPTEVVIYSNGTTYQGVLAGDIVIRTETSIRDCWRSKFMVVGDRCELAEYPCDVEPELHLEVWLNDVHGGNILPGWDGKEWPCAPKERSQLQRDLVKAAREYDRDCRKIVGKFLQRVGSALMR